MDLTYDLNLTPFRFDASAGVDVAEQTRINGFAAVRSFGNDDRESTTTLLQGDDTTDIEFFRVTIDNVVNSGATTYELLGASAVRFHALSGMAVMDTFVNGVNGTVLASGGVNPALNSDTDLFLSSPAASFALVATDNDTTGSRENFDNRWEGVAVQFTQVVPEPGAITLFALGIVGLAFAITRRRRRQS